MTKVLCPKCRLEMSPTDEGNGVNVIEFASIGPYKIWQADELHCRGCLTRVVTGYASKAHEHWQPDFAEELRRCLLPGHRPKLRLSFENLRQRDYFEPLLDVLGEIFNQSHPPKVG